MNKFYASLLFLGFWYGTAFSMEKLLIQRSNRTANEYSSEEENSDDEYYSAEEEDQITTVPHFIKDEFNIGQYEFKPTLDEKKIFEKIVTEGPEKMQQIYNLHKLSKYSRLPKFIFMMGPDFGKSSAAKALACELGKCFFIPVSEILEGNRNAEAVKLRDMLKTIASQNEKKCIVFDNWDLLINSRHEDIIENLNVAVLCDFIDSIKKNPNIFVIGTGEKKIRSKRLFDRMGFNCMTITPDLPIQELLKEIQNQPPAPLGINAQFRPLDYDPSPYIFKKVKIASELYIPDNKDKFLFESAFRVAPKKIKNILESENSTRENNCLLLVGRTGIGKTLLAKAMSCKLGKCYLVHSLWAKSHRNETGLLLDAYIEDVAKEPGKSTIVLDHIDVFLEHYKSPIVDHAYTAEVLLKQLNKQRNNNNLFFICSSDPDGLDKLPKEILNRFEDNIVWLGHY